MKKNVLIAALAVLAVIAAGETILLIHTHMTKPKQTTSAVAPKYIPLTVTLHDGKLVKPIQTFVVKQGTNLQFTIDSNIVGKIGAPVSPAQTITFTKNPLVFHFTAAKLGNFPMTYEADGSSKVILIANVTVHSSN